MMITNQFGQPIGSEIKRWNACLRPSRGTMKGRYCHLIEIDPERDGEQLHEAYHREDQWTYLPYGPFASATEYTQWLHLHATGEDPLFYTIVENKTDRPVGVASYLRIDPTHGVIELGHIHYAPALQKTAAATEAIYLMLKHAFDDLGYRRCEWKCDALNEPSRRAALRFGFTFEGIFRQATIYKGRNRDTAWFSLLDSDWLQVKQGLEAWLDPINFDETGKQRRSLINIRRGKKRDEQRKIRSV